MRSGLDLIFIAQKVRSWEVCVGSCYLIDLALPSAVCSLIESWTTDESSSSAKTSRELLGVDKQSSRLTTVIETTTKVKQITMPSRTLVYNWIALVALLWFDLNYASDFCSQMKLNPQDSTTNHTGVYMTHFCKSNQIKINNSIPRD